MNRKVVSGLLSIPKSLWLDIGIFGLKEGIRCPILFHYNTKVEVRRGGVKTSRERVFFGFGGPEGISANRESWFIVREGRISFRGKANFGKGSSIRIDSGKVEIGKNFSANKNFWLAVNSKFFCSDDVVIGSNVKIRDNDGHQINSKGDSFPVKFGKHIWINDGTVILKGVNIGNNSVIGTASVVTRSICKEKIPENCVIAGNPSHIVKKIEKWKI